MNTLRGFNSQHRLVRKDVIENERLSKLHLDTNLSKGTSLLLLFYISLSKQFKISHCRNSSKIAHCRKQLKNITLSKQFKISHCRNKSKYHIVETSQNITLWTVSTVWYFELFRSCGIFFFLSFGKLLI
jgi:hypothetical protein